MIRRALLAAGTSAAFLVSCGYHTGASADLIPKNVRTISVPAFSTLSARYQLGDEFARSISREFNTRTRFRAVTSAKDADAVLNGRINTVQVNPQVLDPASGKATSVQLVVVVTVRLVQQSTGKVLFERANWVLRQNYEVSVYPQQYFDESGPAMDRMSRDIAHDIVSGVVENF
jgi:hypothetical protein